MVGKRIKKRKQGIVKEQADFMIIAKNKWMDSWTNCHIVNFSKMRHHENTIDTEFTGIEGYLSITRIPLYNPICKDVNINEFCDHCLKCKKRKYRR